MHIQPSTLSVSYALDLIFEQCNTSAKKIICRRHTGSDRLRSGLRRTAKLHAHRMRSSPTTAFAKRRIKTVFTANTRQRTLQLQSTSTAGKLFVNDLCYSGFVHVKM